MAETHAVRFQAGGTLRPDAVYAERPADRELPEALRQGELCYVLATRQIGKSSLRARAARTLRGEGIESATVDLTEIGSHDVTPDDWYFGQAAIIAEQLDLDDPDDFWGANERLTPVQRWTRWLRDGVLAASDGPVVVFIDEVDSTLSLPFSRDDYFAAIRACYNARADDPAWQRLTFCLLGVAAPSDLIADGTRTPFNVGRSIRLEDFSRDEIALFASGFDGTAAEAARLLDAVYSWTAGHPYMTQRVCADIVNGGSGSGTSGVGDGVEAVVRRRFLDAGRAEDANLVYAERAFARARGDVHTAPMLRLYRRLREGESVTADPSDATQLALRLTGLVAERDVREGGRVLDVRSRIFGTVFDDEWVRAREAERLFADPLDRWRRSGRRADALLRGAELDEARAWAQNREDLTKDENDFLTASVEDEGRRRSRSRLAKVFAGAAVLLAVAFLVTGWQWLEARAQRAAAQQAGYTALLAQYRATAAREVALVLKKRALEAQRDADRRRKEAVNEREEAQRQRQRAEEQSALAQRNALLAAAARADDQRPERRILTALEAFRRIPADAKAPVLRNAEKTLRAAVGAVRGVPLNLIAKEERSDGSGPPVLIPAGLSPDGVFGVSIAGDGSLDLVRLDGGDFGATVAWLDPPQGAAITALAVGWEAAAPVGGQPARAVAAGRADGTIVVWSPAAVEPVVLAAGGPSPIRTIAVDAAGATVVATSADERGYIWNANRPTEGPERLGGADGRPTTHAVAVNAAGDAVVTGHGDGKARLRRKHGGGFGDVSALPTGTVSGPVPVAITEKGGRIAVGSALGGTRLWDTAKLVPGAPADQKDASMAADDHLARVRAVAVSDAGRGRPRLVVAYEDRTVHRLDPVLSGTGWELKSSALEGHDTELRAAGVTGADGTVVTLPNAGPARRWRMDEISDSLEPRRLVALDGSPGNQADRLAFSPDGRRLVAAGSTAGKLWLWDLTAPAAPPRALRGAHPSRALSVAFASNGQLVSAGKTGLVCLWPTLDPLDGSSELRHLHCHPAPDGPESGGDSEAAVWGLAVADCPSGPVVASGARDGAITLWAPELGAGGGWTDLRASHRIPLPRRSASVWSLAIEPSACLLAAGTSDGVHVWDLARPDDSGQALDDYAGTTHSVAFAPEGQSLWLAAGGLDGRTRAWKRSGRAPFAFVDDRGGHVRPVRGLAVARLPEGRRLVSLGTAGQLRLRAWPAGKAPEVYPRAILQTSAEETQGMALSPDGTTVAVGDHSGGVTLWRVDLAGLRGAAAQLAGRELGADELRAVIGSAPEDAAEQDETTDETAQNDKE